MRRRPGDVLISLRISGSRDISANIDLMSSPSLNIFCPQDLSSGKAVNSTCPSTLVNLTTRSPCMPYHESLRLSHKKTCPLFMLTTGSKLEYRDCKSVRQ